MTTPDELASVGLCLAATKLEGKAHFARAAEKYGAAAAAAAQELAAEDCLIVVFLRSKQAICIVCHLTGPTLSYEERHSELENACLVFEPCISRLTRRKEAGTLLPGSCRSAETAWFRTLNLQLFVRPHNDCSAAEAHAFADGLAAAVGVEVYCCAAVTSNNILVFSGGTLQLQQARFVASALDLLASQPLEPLVIRGAVVSTTNELALAKTMRRSFQNEKLEELVGSPAFVLVRDAWRRVQRSGVLEQRLMGRVNEPDDPSHCLGARQEAAMAQGAERGLHICALAGCAAKEVHVSQFKKCGACMKIAYCCREHQVEAWPVHKAACKAARKTAAPKDDS